MEISNISIKAYKRNFGRTITNHKKFEKELPTILRNKLTNLQVNTLDMYNMDEEKHAYEAGSNNSRLVMFNNATAYGAGDTIILPEPLKINGIENNYIKFLAPLGDGIIIKSENEIALAEWREGKWELNILFDLFNEFNQNVLDIFSFMMDEFEKLVWLPKTYENSWKHTQDKIKLTNVFTDLIRRGKEERIKEDVRQIIMYEDNINDYRKRMKQTFDSLIQRRRQVEIERESIKNVSDGLIKDLDLIIANSKIEDLQIKDGKIIVNTVPLLIYSDKGKIYYGGKYRIEMNPDNSDIKFFGGSPHRGYWTDHDPHPHVNGSNGHPCLGNVGSTIAELCSQMQIYALTMVCIDYLESANTNDGAGAKVVNWDEVDKNGNLLKPIAEMVEDDDETEEEEDVETTECGHCHEQVNINTIVTVYDDVNDDDELIGEHEVCPDCLANEYHFDENFEEYLRD